MVKLVPFADDAASISVGAMTIENGRDCVSLYGSLDLTRDKHGLGQALALKTLLDEVVEQLQRVKDLPDAIPAAKAVRSVPNPFG